MYWLWMIGMIFRVITNLINPEFLGIDSFAYLNVAKTGILQDYTFLSVSTKYLGVSITHQILIILTCFSFGILYLCCRKIANKNNSIIATLMYMFSPLVFFNTSIGVYDKNPLTLFMIICIIFCVLYFRRRLLIISLIILMILFCFMWQGAIAMWLLLSFFFFIESFDLPESFTRSVIIRGLGMSLILIIFATILKGYKIIQDKFLIMEARNILQVGFSMEYLFFLLCFILIIATINLEIRSKRFIAINLILTFLAFVFIFRFNIFFLPFFYIAMAFLLQSSKLDFKIIFVSFFILVVIFSPAQYLREPKTNKAIRDMMDYVNEQNHSCIINDWGMGHIYQYYTNKTVKYKAHPTDIQDQIRYMVYGKPTECLIIASTRDYQSLNIVIEHLDMINITPWYIQHEYNQSPKWVYANRTYWVIE